MLRVIQSIDSLHTSKGGPSRTVMQLSTALSQVADLDVSIVCNESSCDSTLNISNRGIYSGITRSVHTEPSTRAVIHDNGIWRPSNLAAAFGAMQTQTPYIVSPHGMLEAWALNHHHIRKQCAYILYQRWCLRRAAAFHATCDEEAASIRRLGLTQPIAVIGNGIETAPLIDAPADRKQRIALFLSRLHPKKGVSELIAAWSIVKPSGWKLRIVGPDDGDYRKVIEKEIADRQLHSVVELHGEVNDQEKWHEYNRAELFVLPTFSENFGLVIGEALASGLPVITTTGTPWKPIATKQCGWIIKPTVEDLTVALSEATSLPRETLLAMGAIGKTWIPTEFSWQQIAKQMAHFYAWVVDGMPSSSMPACVII